MQINNTVFSRVMAGVSTLGNYPKAVLTLAIVLVWLLLFISFRADRSRV